MSHHTRELRTGSRLQEILEDGALTKAADVSRRDAKGMLETLAVTCDRVEGLQDELRDYLEIRDQQITRARAAGVSTSLLARLTGLTTARISQLTGPTTVSCGECGLELDEGTNTQPENRRPCPRCGSTSRAFAVHVVATGSGGASLGVVKDPKNRG